jgi:hypothetical protein
MAVVLLARTLVDDPIAIYNKLCDELASFCAAQPKLGGSCARGRGRRQAYLVLCMDLGKLDRLLEDAVDLLERDGLLPVIECAGDEDVVRSVFPEAWWLANVEPRAVEWNATYHEKVYFPIVGGRISVQSGIAKNMIWN